MVVKDNIILNNTLFAASALATAIALSFMQAPHNLHWLGWFALVPLIVATMKLRITKRTLLIAYLVFAGFWLANLYWVGYISIPGWIAFSLFSGIYWPFSISALKYINRKKVPLLLATPLIWLGAQSWQGIFFGGFDWHFLGHSQYQNIHIIQIADIFGEAGVSFILAMTNGMVASLFIFPIARKTFWHIAVTIVTIASVWVYGDIALKESLSTTIDGPLVGIAQPNIASADKENMANAEKIIDEMIELSKGPIQNGAAIVAWPETMVLGIINKEYLVYCDSQDKHRKLHRKISDFAKDNCDLLVGSLSASVGPKDGFLIVTDEYNSAFLYQKDGSQFPKRYDKIHLVPFGEYIPFNDNKLIKKLMMLFIPYDYDYSLTPGKEYTNFNINDGVKNYNFATMICYEDTDAQTVRKLAYNRKNGTKRQWLFNISNDGWYVKFDKDGVYPSSELSQRTAINVFRAVENHITIARSVNTGISCIIDPSGRLRNDFVAGDLPKNVLEREAVSGWLADFVPIDTRVTIFSKVGAWHKWVLATIYPLLAVAGFFSIRDSRKQKNKKTR